MEQTILGSTSKHTKDKKVFASRHIRFMNEKSHLLSLIAFFDEVDLLDEGRARDDAHVEFSKAFDSVSQTSS